MTTPLWKFIDRVPAKVESGSDGDKTVPFRLIYEGELLSAQADKTAVRRNKHAIRKQLHGQLKALWSQNSTLQSVLQHPAGPGWSGDLGRFQEKRDYNLCGHEFIPLVASRFNLVCSLDVLFLRREAPGAIVQGGDIDNRIKTLFDGLRIPDGCSAITDDITEDETPFYCLLQDDRLITQVNITTDQLLRPLPQGSSSHSISDVVLIINVRLEQTTKLW